MKELLVLNHVSLSFGNISVLSDFNLTIHSGERVAIMGPSGCGKTSLLRLAAGLIKPTEGRIIRHTPKIAVQFQESRLLPQLTAAENVNVVLSDTVKTMNVAREWLARVELDDAGDLYPNELSGGMAQRVALARTLAYGGDLLLLDEPFRGLDDVLKARIMSVVADACENRAVLLVTHDRHEAEEFAHRIVELTAKKQENS